MRMKAPMHAETPKPVYRHPLRRKVGRQYFILRRKWQDVFSKTAFAYELGTRTLPFTLVTHQTPLLRKLKEVDMHLQHNKAHNLGLALRRIDGLLIRPEETFSYWHVLGLPTRRKGYKMGMQLQQGKVATASGGGLCQLSNMIFWLAMHTPLEIVERWRHSFDVFPDANRTQPFGSGATCSYNYIDLRLANRTAVKFQLRLRLDDEYLHGEVRSDRPPEVEYEVFESDHLFRTEYWGHTRHNRIARHVKDKDSGEILRTEPLVENHAITMYNPLLEGGE